MVHDHGPTEGRGLECPEHTTVDGQLKGDCLVQKEFDDLMNQVKKSFNWFEK